MWARNIIIICVLIFKYKAFALWAHQLILFSHYCFPRGRHLYVACADSMLPVPTLSCPMCLDTTLTLESDLFPPPLPTSLTLHYLLHSHLAVCLYLSFLVVDW